MNTTSRDNRKNSVSVQITERELSKCKLVAGQRSYSHASTFCHRISKSKRPSSLPSDLTCQRLFVHCCFSIVSMWIFVYVWGNSWLSGRIHVYVSVSRCRVHRHQKRMPDTNLPQFSLEVMGNWLENNTVQRWS